MAQAVAEALVWLSRNWSLIARLIGLGVVAVAGYEVGKAVVGAAPAFEQAVSITAYAIPVMVYGMVFNMLISMFRTISESIRETTAATPT